MPTLLVVDDSQVDRSLVGGLLNQVSGWSVEYAENGVAALEAMEKSSPDLVVTDLIMPEMDGLELVKQVKETHPLVPVILMTSKGNEEIAVTALKTGAASYSPKNTLARDLVDTIRSVLSVSSQEVQQARLLECLSESECTFVLNNDAGLIPALVGYLQDDATRIGLCDSAERVRVGVALDEALVNALYHGNLELSSDLRDTDYDKYSSLVRQRAGAPPFCERRIHVESKLSAQEGRFVIRDEGRGFNPHDLPDPTDPANLENLGGRGILLMRTFMDNVEYNESGNEVVLIKRPKSNSEPDSNSH